jgi:transposase
MAGRTLMALDVRELLRRLRAGQSDRNIRNATGTARKTVRRYREIAQQQGWLGDGPLPELADLDAALKELAPASPLPPQPFTAAPFQDVITRLRRQGVEMKAIHQRLSEDHGYTGSYSALWRFVRHLEPCEPAAFVRLETPAGQQAQVDFTAAGTMIDPQSGRSRKVWCFVMTLSCSRHQFAILVFDQKVETWLRCHRLAFEHFGGVPRQIVIDNLKAAITKAAMYDPVVQRSYRECAEHYGFLISPCRPRTPEHKGKVESGCRYVARNFLAGRESQTIATANTALQRWVMEVAGTRTHGTTRRQPLAVFRDVEQAALLPLPSTAYDLGVWRQCKLHPDCHVVVDGAYYSAPHRLIGKTLWIRSNGAAVQIFHEYQRLATHDWGKPGTRRTITDHYPPDKAAYLMATPRFCRDRAGRVGAACAALVEQLLSERPLDRLRAVQAVIRLADRFGDQRLERACARALYFGETSPKALRRILDHGLENEPLPGLSPPSPQMSFAFARPGSEIFPCHGGPGHG